MAPLPGQVYGGTITFIVLAFVASLVNLYLKRTKKLNKDNAQCVRARTRTRTRRPARHNTTADPMPPKSYLTCPRPTRICCTSIIVATICLWLMWVCTWLHQWHPLIVPTISKHAAPPTGGAPGGHR